MKNLRLITISLSFALVILSFQNCGDAEAIRNRDPLANSESPISAKQDDQKQLKSSSLTKNLEKIKECSSSKKKSILEEASRGNSSVGVDCNLTLGSKDRITKVLYIQTEKASGISINCNGALIDGSAGTYNGSRSTDMIVVRSKHLGEDKFSRPKNVKISNCRVNGSIRIWGMASNANNDIVRKSSYRKGHAQRARNASPYRISFNKMTIRAHGRTAFFVGPGVTRASITNSTFLGQTPKNGAAIYIEAEAAHTLIRNNIFKLKTGQRELISIDSSGYNTIVGNDFSYLSNGGIFLYRNCGEKGVVRHSSPAKNKIINNVFRYTKDPQKPAIHIGSRQGKGYYCDLDKGYPFGSSKSDLDYARYNIVGENQFIGISSKGLIVDNDKYNLVFSDNKRVSKKVKRESSCYYRNAYPSPYVKSGETLSWFKKDGKIECFQKQLICDDGSFVTKSFKCSSPPVLSKNICYLELNNKKRWVVREQDGKGIFYTSQSQKKLAEQMLQKFVQDGTCDADSLEKNQKHNCYINVNRKKRWAIRNKRDDKGILYFATKNQAQEALPKVISKGQCK